MTASRNVVSFSLMGAGDTSVQPEYGPPLHDVLYLRMLHAGRTVIGPSWNSAQVRSSFWRLYVNADDGAALQLARGERFFLERRCVYLIPPWLTFTCHCTGPVRHLYGHFDLVGLPPALVRAVFPRPMLASPAAMRMPTVRLLWARMVEGQAPPPATLCLMKSLVYRLLSHLLDEMAPNEQHRLFTVLQPGHPLHGVLNAIEAYLARPLPNAELAAYSHVSESHLVRLFRALFNQSPAQYVQERRIARAAQALLFTGDSIEQVAAQVGFANRFHFSRVFKQHMGLPPATYRHRGHV